MAEITRLLGSQGISIESLIQRPPKAGADRVHVVIITDRVAGKCIESALNAIEALETVGEHVVALRVENFEES